MKPYNKPDLNAPRFRPKKLNLLNKAFCDQIREKYPNMVHYTDKQIKEVVDVFNKMVWETVVEQRDGIELLEQLGYLFIGSCPRKKYDNPDRIKSAELGYKVQHQNWESDQYTCKVFYTNYETKYNFKFHQLWGFNAHRDFRRAAGGENYRENWKKYVIVDPLVKVSRMFRKNMARDYMKKKEETLLENYDEFDMT